MADESEATESGTESGAGGLLGGDSGGSGEMEAAGSAGDGVPEESAEAGQAGKLSPLSVGADGRLSEGWQKHMGELAGDKTLASFHTVQDLAKSLVNTKRMVGADKNRFAFVPTETSTEAERAEFFRKIGVPESPDAYEIKRPTLPEGVSYNEDAEKAFRDVAHKSGMTPKQVQASVELYNQLRVAEYESLAQAREGEQEQMAAALRAELGVTFQPTVDAANKVVRTFDLAPMLREKGLQNDPDIVKAFAQIAKAMDEDMLVGSDTATGAQGVQSQIDSIKNDPNHPYWHKAHPNHSSAVNTMNRLYARLGLFYCYRCLKKSARTIRPDPGAAKRPDLPLADYPTPREPQPQFYVKGSQQWQRQAM